MAKKQVIRELSIYINDKEVVNSFNGINRAIGQTNSEIKNLNKNSATYDHDLKKLQGTLSELKEKQKEFKEELAETNKEYDSFKEASSDLFSGLMSGNLQQAQAGFLGLRTGLINTTKAALAFIATPIGAVIAVLTTIALATREWAQYNIEVAKTNKLIQGITGLAEEALDTVRIQAVAMEKTFGKSIEETLGAAKVLVNEFGITYEEALAEIEAGLIRGGAANEEFLESIKEYGTFFAQAGFSIEEFRNIVQAGYDLGIYTDKLPDAIKEFSLSITEQTKASRDALTNAFGEEFTGKLLSGIKDGSISVKEALSQVAAEAEKVGLNSQQAQQLTADLFRGAGEDAGGALKIFQAVNDSYDNQGRQLTELEQLTKELSEANLELAEAQDMALKSDGFARWQVAGELALTKLKTGFYQLIATLVNTREEMEKLASDEAEKKNNIYLRKEYEKQFEEYLKIQQKYSKDRIDIEKVTNERVKQIEEWMSTAKSEEVRKRYQLEIDTIKKVASSKIDAQNSSKKLSQEEMDALKKAADEKKKLQDKKDKADEKAKKLEEDRLKAILEAQIRLAKAQLAYFVALNTSRLDGEKELTEALVQEEVSRLELIANKQKEALEQDYKRKLEAAEKDSKSDEERRLLKESINLEYLTAVQNLELQFYATTQQLKDEFDLQVKERKAEELALENELQLAEAQSKSEAETIQEEQKYKEDLNRYIKLYEDKKITEDQFNRFVNALDEKLSEQKRQRQLNDTATMLGAMGTLAGALGEMFGQSKELAILQANISGAQAIMSIWAGAPMVNPVVDAVIKGVLTAAQAITTAAQIKNISKQKAPKTPKFFYGGDTGSDAALGYDQYGPVTGVVHKNEWVAPEVMTSSPKYAATFGWLENERKKIMNNGFVDGGSTSPGTVTSVPETGNPDDDFKAVLMDLRNILSSGIVAKLFIGYQEAEEIEKLNKEREDSNKNGIISQ